MTDAEFLRDRACDMRDSAPIYADRLLAIAARLEEIDAPLTPEQAAAFRKDIEADMYSQEED